MTRISIREARSDEFGALNAIEMDALTALIDAGVPIPGAPTALSHDMLGRISKTECLLVASDATDKPVGFIAAEVIEAMFYIAEIDVVRSLQGKGIGRRLIAAVMSVAKSRGLTGLALTTYRFAPFNYSFYLSIGFEEAQRGTIPIWLQQRLADEAKSGLLTERRVAMMLMFPPEPRGPAHAA
ncbi:GNAT family N-acetyltransferase [Metarhizobium album]|uniref:GNAT family N-acetyltransferase n=1 Tax=Metarhizobium album TaxID=2182425 RepID=A0A2U2DK66_9HYPH|nr:GNAT family N-acetyltransferase [Rhizobium album]PWE53660.1 GNAT family N-acetyltransferase [Rhizobium album]